MNLLTILIWKALEALKNDKFKDQIVPISVMEQTFLDENQKKVTKSYTVTQDEGPRADTSKEILAKLRLYLQQVEAFTAEEFFTNE